MSPRDPWLPAIDDEVGPMPPLSAAESEAIAWAAVSRWAARPPGLDPIDDLDGPARSLDDARSLQLAQAALRARARRDVWTGRLPARVGAAVAALCLSAALGVAFAAYRSWPAPAADSGERGKPRRAASVDVPQKVAPEPAPAPSPQALDGSRPSTQRESTGPDQPAAVEAKLGPDALLARANAWRAKRRWRAAERLYRQVAAAGVSEQQRYVALVAAAELSLEHLGRPARALTQYQAALALMPGGILDEQALYGVAQCQRALDHPAAELRALQRLGEAHPRGMFSSAATPRRLQLEASETPTGD